MRRSKNRPQSAAGVPDLKCASDERDWIVPALARKVGGKILSPLLPANCKRWRRNAASSATILVSAAVFIDSSTFFQRVRA